MTFAEILLDTMKNEPNEANFFDYLFYTKHYCILLESLKGKSFNIPLSVAKCFLKIFSTENGSY